MPSSRIKALGIVIAGAIGLASCASPGAVAELNAARADFEAKTRPAQMMVQYDLVNSAGLTTAQRESRERDAARAFSPACVKPYTESLLADVATAVARGKATGSLSAADSLPEAARGLDREFDTCLVKFGVVGFNFMKLEDGHDQRLPEYLASIVGSMQNYGAASAQAADEQQDNAAIVVASLAAIAQAGSAVNPNQTYVTGYVRRDGTDVHGYWRTDPNGTCLDNIRGCR